MAIDNIRIEIVRSKENGLCIWFANWWRMMSCDEYYECWLVILLEPGWQGAVPLLTFGRDALDNDWNRVNRGANRRQLIVVFSSWLLITFVALISTTCSYCRSAQYLWCRAGPAGRWLRSMVVLALSRESWYERCEQCAIVAQSQHWRQV